MLPHATRMSRMRSAVCCDRKRYLPGEDDHGEVCVRIVVQRPQSVLRTRNVQHREAMECGKGPNSRMKTRCAAPAHPNHMLSVTQQPHRAARRMAAASGTEVDPQEPSWVTFLGFRVGHGSHRQAILSGLKWQSRLILRHPSLDMSV